MVIITDPCLQILRGIIHVCVNMMWLGQVHIELQANTIWCLKQYKCDLILNISSFDDIWVKVSSIFFVVTLYIEV